MAPVVSEVTDFQANTLSVRRWAQQRRPSSVDALLIPLCKKIIEQGLDQWLKWTCQTRLTLKTRAFSLTRGSSGQTNHDSRYSRYTQQNMTNEQNTQHHRTGCTRRLPVGI